MSSPLVVLYQWEQPERDDPAFATRGYGTSPFALKARNLLTLKRIPHKRVVVSSVLPRPEFSDLFGITHRRTPAVAIGNDIYFDTSLIASVLERRFAPSAGYGTLFPPRKGGGKADTGLTKALAMFWTDRPMFRAVADIIPYGEFDADFVKDREGWLGGKIDTKILKALQPKLKSLVSSQIALIEEQLSDGREYLQDTDLPSLADLSAHFPYAWIHYFQEMQHFFDGVAYPNFTKWFIRTTNYLAYLESKNVNQPEIVDAKSAAAEVCAAAHEDSAIVGFDAVEADRLEVKLGGYVVVHPKDTGVVPMVGELLGLNREEVVMASTGTAGTVHVHFPRLNFVVKPARHSTTKL